MSRSCLETAQWEAADFLGCSSPLFVRLGSEVRHILKHFKMQSVSDCVGGWVYRWGFGLVGVWVDGALVEWVDG